MREERPLFGGLKYLSPLRGRPLIASVVEAASGAAESVLVVAPSEDEAAAIRGLFPQPGAGGIQVFFDEDGIGAPLAMARTAFQRSASRLTLLLPGDTPFLSPDLLATLAELCLGRDAVIPKRPLGEAEPLLAAYQTGKALDAARAALAENAKGVMSMVERLRHVMYISSSVIAELDPDLLAFFNVNTPLDLRRAEAISSGFAAAGRRRRAR